jgi:hypothetical protein
MALCCEAFYVKQSVKQSLRNAEPALKGWFSGFEKQSTREPCSQNGSKAQQINRNWQNYSGINYKFNSNSLTNYISNNINKQ